MTVKRLEKYGVRLGTFLGGSILIICLSFLIYNQRYIVTILGNPQQEIPFSTQSVSNDDKEVVLEKTEVTKKEDETQKLFDEDELQTDGEKIEEQKTQEEKKEGEKIDEEQNNEQNEVGSRDTDRDGLSDNDEIRIGTNQNLIDTDKDGRTDNDEVDALLDPLNPDSDNDGVCDGGKSFPGVCVLGPDPAPYDATIPHNNIKGGGDDEDLGTTPVVTNNEAIEVKEVAPAVSPECGPRDSESLYTFTQNTLALEATSTGLCPSDSVVVDFGFDTKDKQRMWMCQSQAGNSDVCSVTSERCGDDVVNGTEACDGNDDSCSGGGECTSLCVCLQHTSSGACGNISGTRIYDTSTRGTGLRKRNIGLCDEGKIDSFVYNPQRRIWSWKCLGVGGAENSLCFAEQGRCGDGLTNGDEQCDDGNQSDGDGCSQSCRAESLGALAPARTIGCGNAVNDLDEQCDDGNLVNGDGCDASCEIEDGWRCTISSPSQCGTLECFQHGERYTQYNIYGQCCGGLEGLPFQHIPEKLISQGVQMTICYDQDIDTPYCLPFAATPGRYGKKDTDAEKKSLLLKDSCVDVYKDYYQLVADLIHQDHSYCQYTDEPYDRVAFRDIFGSRKSSAIKALVEHCIVKGPGDRYTRYRPDKTITRAEFVKILVKTMYIGQEYDVHREGVAYDGNTYFLDISQDFRGAQYIAKAYELGLLDSLFPGGSGAVSFQPNKSMSTKEVIRIMKNVTQGQALAPEYIEELFSGRKNPTRADIAMLMVTTWRTVFRDYLLLQGQNESRLHELLQQLRGQHYSEQYRVIMEEIYTLEQKNEHFSAGAVHPDNELFGEYLRGIAQ